MEYSMIVHFLIFVSLSGGAFVLWWRTRNKGAMIMLAAQISVLVVGFGGFAFSVFHFSDRPYPYGIGQIIYIGWMISSLLFCAGFLWSALTLKSEQKSDGNVTR